MYKYNLFQLLYKCMLFQFQIFYNTYIIALFIQMRIIKTSNSIYNIGRSTQ